MKKKRSFFYLLVAFFVSNYFLSLSLFAQQKSIQYSRDFEFREGVYSSISNFKNNSPIIRSKIIFNSNKDDKDFLKYVLDKSTITYVDSVGMEQQIKIDKVWGYCSNGTVFVNFGTGFNRVTIIGSLCHFVAVMPTPVGVNDPFNPYQPYGSALPRYIYVTNQYFLDFGSGNISVFDVEHMEIILQRDETLYKAFTALKKKQKRDSIFLYLRKYNEKHLIYFPE
jgi:hypothetical protein